MDVKNRILTESGKMFSKFGIRSITMDHIANELGISKRTLYDEFKDKDDLVRQVIMEGARLYKELCLKLIEDSGNIIDAIFEVAKVHNDIFQKLNPLFFEDLKKYHPAICNQIVQKGNVREYTISASLIKRGIQEEIFKNELNIEIVNLFIHKTVDTIKMDEFVGAKIEDIKTSIFIPYLEGISTDKGRKLIEKHLNN